MSCESMVDEFAWHSSWLIRRSVPVIRCRKADIMEGSAEREALDGTVHGFESWIEGWQRQHDQAVAKRSSQTSRQRKWMKRRTDDPIDSNTEALLEGIAAWIRGWEDAQEGFRNRERERRLRREERQNLLTNIDN